MNQFPNMRRGFLSVGGASKNREKEGEGDSLEKSQLLARSNERREWGMNEHILAVRLGNNASLNTSPFHLRSKLYPLIRNRFGVSKN